jgi:protein involved in ribonucleotide reduction
MKLEVKRDDFLANSENKQRFIKALSAEHQTFGVHTEHAKQDAYLLIVQTAVAAFSEANYCLFSCDSTHHLTDSIYTFVLK